MTKLVVTMKKNIYRIQLVKYFIQYIRKIDNTELNIKIISTFRKLAYSEAGSEKSMNTQAEILTHLKQDPNTKNLIEKKWWSKKVISLEEFKEYPKGSLGEVFSQHCITNSLDPNLFPETAYDSDMSYISLRGLMFHDVFHIVTDYNTTVEGEIALASFLVGQTMSPIAGFLLAGALLNSVLKGPKVLFNRFDIISHAFLRGKKAKCLLGIKWEDRWQEPLEKIKIELDLADKINHRISFPVEHHTKLDQAH